MSQAKFLEVFRLVAPARKVRGDESCHALVGDVGREPEGIRLERIARVDAIRPDHAPARDLVDVAAEPLDDFLFQRRIAKVQEMPGSIETKAFVLERDGVAARQRELLEGPVGDARALERERCGKASQAGAEYGDGHAFFGKGARHGRRDRTEGSRGCKACRRRARRAMIFASKPG
jgi:hypothetical protein